MPANTGDTEVETLETPTPPQHGHARAQSTPDRNRHEDVIEEESDEDELLENGSEDILSETERSGQYIYNDESDLYTDESDLFSGDVECCFRNSFDFIYNILKSF